MRFLNVFLLLAVLGLIVTRQPALFTEHEDLLIRSVVWQEKKAEAKDEIKHPLIRRLLEMLDESDEGGSAEERRMVRETLIDADRQLRRILNTDLRSVVRRANKPKRHFRVGPSSSGVGRVRPAIRRPPKTRRNPSSPPKKTPADGAKSESKKSGQGKQK